MRGVLLSGPNPELPFRPFALRSVLAEHSQHTHPSTLPWDDRCFPATSVAPIFMRGHYFFNKKTKRLCLVFYLLSTIHHPHKLQD